VSCESCELRRKTRTGEAGNTSDGEERMMLLRVLKSAMAATGPGHRNTNVVTSTRAAAAMGLQPNRRTKTNINTNVGVAGVAVETGSVRVIPSIHHPVEIETRGKGDTECTIDATIIIFL
jgi:hypothetical protein